MDKNRIPVLVGIGQLVHREKTQIQLDPIKMMEEVCRKAAEDARLDNLRKVDTLYIVNCISKVMSKPAQELSELLGIQPSDTGYSWIGACAPQWFVNRAAERIFSGKSELVLICGAEAFYSHEKIQTGDSASSFFVEDDKAAGSLYIGDVRKPVSDLEIFYGLMSPLLSYSIFENALRAHNGKSIFDHSREIASFCSQFSQIASRNPYAWFQESKTEDEIATVTDKNRMVVFPYTKSMCSNMTVNQAAALIMTNLARAEAMGIPKGKVIFLRGCGNAEDVWLVSERPALWASPSVADAVNMALNQLSISLDEIEYLDLYSCFPCAPRIARKMLNISYNDPRSLTVTGGMSFFGGPGNNYSLHAICHIVSLLRANPASYGMVQALSWFISKHSVGIYSASPGKTPWKPLEIPHKVKEYPRVNVVTSATGKGTIESYTIVYNRYSQIDYSIVVCRDKEDNRFLARVKPEEGMIEQMTREEPIGRDGRVEHDASNSTNWFYIE
ncbi:MAG: hypothetical protein SVZ03_12245 [Spirochaetota bacterium]|nr:hypothetical protein [Spirochaetota bacterium]